MNLVDLPVFAEASPEAGELIFRLSELFAREPKVTSFVLAVGLPQAEIDFQRPVLDIWPDVLRVAARSGKLRELVQHIADDPDSAAMSDYFSRLLSDGRADDVGGEDPYLAALIAARRALIDRKDLRLHLKELAKDDGARVLLVSGDRGVGKSYTWYFIVFLARRTGTFVPYLVDVSRQAGAPVTAYDVVADIAGQLGWPEPPHDAVGQPATVVRKLVAWVINKARDMGRPVWLVFDGFVDDTSDQQARSLLGELALAANRFELGQMRLSLLQYSGQLMPEVDMDVLKDPLQRPGRADWLEFFRTVAIARGFALPEEALAGLVRTLLGPRGAGKNRSLQELGNAAVRIAVDTFGEEP